MNWPTLSNDILNRMDADELRNYIQHMSEATYILGKLDRVRHDLAAKLQEVNCIQEQLCRYQKRLGEVDCQMSQLEEKLRGKYYKPPMDD